MGLAFHQPASTLVFTTFFILFILSELSVFAAKTIGTVGSFKIKGVIDFLTALLEQYLPVFSFFVKKTPKYQWKHSRGKSGRYKIIWQQNTKVFGNSNSDPQHITEGSFLVISRKFFGYFR